MSRALTFLAGAATGASAAYFLDPQGGAARRRETKDKALPAVKSAASTVSTQASHQAHRVAGQATAQAGKVAEKARSVAPGDHGGPDDVTLARTVETEIFRPEDAPKGQVSVNAENGVVFLRGEVSAEWIERLGSEAEQVAGVKAVRNLLHAPGTPAPTSP
jgi:osmotically-inducible protein OsmY